ncbi:spermidine/putrescine ABC transporter ATP-binding protein [Oleiphilus sp. HI0009]|nr:MULTISPECIES: ABC transporter ATP-binding protein [unclassified Oleiphilus]KZX82789.1 spermidine/putrescine ABC transporter ATP-binding protein [Oleiphilus sp. HI0009]MCH2157579.1 ABC transporter ATP-binding protein [Oleiphilaceae bacterium]KZY61440.1 spermidine/putrescine ABC transporter ATP-binding protein [Oleiphilus sp. HI0066]KZY76899.1 spermidine/putrescine ABC transporter ATP-binding protein [Oleiphilus sp. HI0067]KZZ59932.1 spermidine/putrescine ABC transporter ATP-binding protein [
MSCDLECQHLVKQFDKFTAVDDVSFSIPKGSFFSILGPSGCGKTTLLRMIAGFYEPTSGDIKIKGKSVLSTPPNKRPVNLVFQHLALFPMMSVAENIAYGLRRRKVAKAEIDQRVKDSLERIGLPDAGSKRIDQLSGGQKQRIAIARCMILNPSVLLLDEPLGALDLKLREHMKVELKQLQSQFDTTFVYITHDQSEALVMSDQVAVMNHGRFEQVGTPQELYYEPQTPFVADFVGESNHWEATVSVQDSQRTTLTTTSGLSIQTQTTSNLEIGQTVNIYLRPESITLGQEQTTADNQLQASVKSVLFDGAKSRAIMTNNDAEEIIVSLPQTGEFSDLKAGDKLSLSWRADIAKVFTNQA